MKAVLTAMNRDEMHVAWHTVDGDDNDSARQFCDSSMLIVDCICWKSYA